jgi:hypothetical protein
MKQVYQYKAEAYDHIAGIAYHGCFKTSKEADEFVAQKKKEGAHESRISGGLGNSMYHTYQTFFDVEKYRDDANEWYNA